MPPASSHAGPSLLQQLAYIGSGTVAAIGVLLTEERRRRISTAQRILENKRKLQACERWVGNRAVATAAASRPALHTSEASLDGSPYTWQQSEPGNGIPIDEPWRPIDAISRRAEFLPSEVERIYQRVRRGNDHSKSRGNDNTQTQQVALEDDLHGEKLSTLSSRGTQAEEDTASGTLNKHPSVIQQGKQSWQPIYRKNVLESRHPRYLAQQYHGAGPDGLGPSKGFRNQLLSSARYPSQMHSPNELPRMSSSSSTRDHKDEAEHESTAIVGSPSETTDQSTKLPQSLAPSNDSSDLRVDRLSSTSDAMSEDFLDGIDTDMQQDVDRNDETKTNLKSDLSPLSSSAPAVTQGSSDSRIQSRDDMLDELLRETKGHDFGIIHLIRLINDADFYHEAYEALKKMPADQTQLVEGARFPFGSVQLTKLQREDLVMTTRIAYYLAYQACQRLLSLHRDQEALNLFIDIIGEGGKSQVVLPMLLPARWISRGFLLRLLRASLNTKLWSTSHVLSELSSSYHGKDTTAQTVQAQVDDMLAENRCSEAAKALTLIPKMGLGKMATSNHCIELCDAIISTALAQDQITVAIKLFEWAEGQGFPNKQDRLEPILRFCVESWTLQEQSPENANHSDQKSKKIGTQPILWALSATRGFPNTAIALIQHLLHTRSDWTLDSSIVDSCNVVLQRSWRETSNFQLVRQLYDDMHKSTEGHSSLPVSTYNTWLAICYRSGRKKEAQKCLEDLQSDRGPGADLVSFGEIMRAHAMDGQWATVEAMLIRLHDSGQMPSFSRICYVTFGEIFREFLKTFGVQRGWDFVTKAIEEFGLEPSIRLSNIFLEHCVWQRQWSMPVAWSRWLTDHGFEFHFNALSVLRMMDTFAIRFRPEGFLFVRMCYVLRGTRKGLVTTHLWRKTTEAVAFDARKRGHLDSLESPESLTWQSYVERPLARLNRTYRTLPSVWHVAKGECGLSEREDEKENNLQKDADADQASRPSSSVLDHKMIMAISFRRPAEAVQGFLQSLSSDGFQHSNSSLSIATDASIRACDGYTGPAQDLVKESAAAGIDVTAAAQHFLLQRMRKHRYDNSQAELTEIVVSFYKSLAGLGRRPKHHVCIAAAKHLIVCGRAEGGIELLNFIFHSAYAEKWPMEIAAMSVFLKGYAKLGHLEGIKWVVSKVLEEDMRIDATFCHELRMARQPLRELFKNPGLSQETRNQVQDAIDQLNQWRGGCIERRIQQKERAELDGWELVKIIQELSPDFATDEDVTSDLKYFEIEDTKFRSVDIEGSYAEESVDSTDGPCPENARPKLRD